MPAEDVLMEWQERVANESGHEFLLSGFDDLLSALFPTDIDAIDSIAETLTLEVHRTLRSFERAESYWEKFQAENRYERLSDSWGEFVKLNRRLGGYDLVESNTERRPKCSCGGPHYRFQFKLTEQWRHYINQCMNCLLRLREFAGDTFLLSSEKSSRIQAALVNQEMHVGRGAFVATFIPNIDERLAESVLDP